MGQEQQEYERVLDTKLVASVAATGLLVLSGIVVKTAMNVTFPTLMSEFGVGTATVQWLTTGSLLVISCLVAASSYLKRSFKLSTLHRVSVSVFFAGTVLAAAAPSFPVLLAGRLLEGAGQAIALPLMYNIILEQAPRSKTAQLMGIGGLIMAAAPALGPSLGGLIVETLGWRWIFIVQLPFLLVALLCGVYGIRQVHPVERGRFRWLDYLLLCSCFVCLVLGVNKAAGSGWGSARVLGLLAAALALGAIFVVRSLRAAEPLIHIQILRNPAFACSAAAVLLIQFILLGLGYLLTNYSQLSLGAGSFVAGSLLIPGCILSAVLAPVSGGVADRRGFKGPVLVGNLLMLAGAVGLAALGTKLGLAFLAVGYALFISGSGCASGNSMTFGLSQLPEGAKADGNALINTMQQLAGTIGTAVTTTIVAAAQAAATDIATGTAIGAAQAFALLAVLAAAVAACSLAMFRLEK